MEVVARQEWLVLVPMVAQAVVVRMQPLPLLVGQEQPTKVTLAEMHKTLALVAVEVQTQ